MKDYSDAVKLEILQHNKEKKIHIHISSLMFSCTSSIYSIMFLQCRANQHQHPHCCIVIPITIILHVPLYVNVAICRTTNVNQHTTCSLEYVHIYTSLTIY